MRAIPLASPLEADLFTVTSTELSPAQLAMWTLALRGCIVMRHHLARHEAEANPSPMRRTSHG